VVTIAVDAMGGDFAPKPEVHGAIEAARSGNVRVILVGREDAVREELSRHREASKFPIEVRHASEVITMADSAAKVVRTKKDSSIHVACRLVKEGAAAGVVSGGNTGAVMATAKMINGLVKGVERPALASAMPTQSGRPTVLVDVGANVDSTPRMLAQFAVMGEIYSRTILHTVNPRVGLLSIGEEEHKGNELTRAATPLIKELSRELKFNFIGNVEGRDIFKGTVDVVVCDGFAGNVALKVSEGVAEVIRHLLKESLMSTAAGKIGAMLATGGFHRFKKRIDYSEYGGAPLLGVRGICIICHGSSNGNAIKNAIRVAAESAEARLNARIEEELKCETHSSASSLS
jgi:glycerol-3-phosphate acyltransferase PlsX